MEFEERVQNWMEEMMAKHGKQRDWWWKGAWDSLYRGDFQDKSRTGAGWE